MSAYRTCARPALAPALVPDLPSRSQIASRAAWALALRLGVACGVVGWLAVSPFAHGLGVGFHATAPPLAHDAIPPGVRAFFTTALCATLVARLALRDGPKAGRRTIAYAVVAACVNGVLYFMLEGALSTPTELLYAPLVGLLASMVGVPLGLVFGIALLPFTSCAGAELETPSHRTAPRLAAIGAAALATGAVVVTGLGLVVRLADGWALGLGLSLASLAGLSALSASLGARRNARLARELEANAHPAVLAVPLADVTVPEDTAALTAPGNAEPLAIVSRAELLRPLGERAVALALLPQWGHPDEAA